MKTYRCSGLEIRVVLWPQSTKTSVGPPDSAKWWSGGLLENSSIKEQYLNKNNWHRSFLCFHIFFVKCYVLFKCFVQEKVNYVSSVFDLTNEIIDD